MVDTRTGHHWLSTSASSMTAPQPPQEVPTEGAGPDAAEVDPLQDRSIGLFQRFRRTFKHYGKVMIPVHLVTSSVWFGICYFAAVKGVNVVPFLEMIGVPESLVGLLRDSSSGYALTAYAMYKIATPARYTISLGIASLFVHYLRKHGFLSTPPSIKEYTQDKMPETKECISGEMEETSNKLSDKLQEKTAKERFSERMTFFKNKNS